MSSSLTKIYSEKLKRSQNRFFYDFQEKLEAEQVKNWLQAALSKVNEAPDFESIQNALYFWNEINAHIHTHFSLIELAFQCQTENSEIEAEERRLKEEIEPVCEELNAKIRESLLSSPFINELKEKLGYPYFALLKNQQDAFHPDNIPLETQLNQVMSDYTKLVGQACLEMDGKTYPISHYKKFSSSPDPELRQKSFLSYSAWYLKRRDEFENIYDRALELRQQMGKNLGHQNFIPLGYQKMSRLDYGPEEVAALREQIAEVLVPEAKKIRDWQAKTLGTTQVKAEDGDYFPEWKLGDLKISIAQQPETAYKVYQKISPKLAEHFRRMMEANLIDLEARQGKAPGAFCTDFSDYRVPFVFLNSVGEATDVTTMLHECGHAFQAWESRNIDLLELRWPGLEACEVHSMSMEFLAFPYYEEFFSEEDAEKFRKRHFADSLMIMPYIALVDEFQHVIYEGRAQGAEGRAQLWEELEKKYMPGIDFSSAPDWQRQRWIRQLHIFRAPFYYIDYAIAQIGAWQLWTLSERDHEKAMESYLKLCQLGGTLPLKDFFKVGGLKLPFEKGMLKPLVEEILDIQNLYS